MTEAEWLACDDPEPMLKWLNGGKRRRPTLRKVQMLATACAMRTVRSAGDSWSRRALALADEIADGHVDEAEIRPRVDALAVIRPRVDHDNIVEWALILTARKAAMVPATTARRVAKLSADLLGRGESLIQTDILRCVVGNPFRPVTINPAWQTSNVNALAQAIYEERAFDRLPILADALEDAGCTNAEVLNHCRVEGVHVRGCWVVDLILGKE